MKAKQTSELVEDAIIDNGQVDKVTSPGIHKISIENYHLDKSWISSSGIVHAKNSLSEYKLYLDGYYDGNTALHMDFGNACELYLIDEVEFNKRVAVAEESKWIEDALAENPKLKSPKASKTFQEYKKAFEEENEGKYIIPDVGEQSFEAVKVLCARCKADPYLSQILDGANYQKSFYWIDEETGLKMKSRPDLPLVNHGVLIDIKTTLNGSPQKWSKTLADLHYPMQGCVQIAGVEATGLMKVEKYFWLVLEKNAPFNATLYEFDMGDVAVIMDELRFQLRKLKKAYDNDVWPGYGEQADNKYGILTAKIPNWYILESNN